MPERGPQARALEDAAIARLLADHLASTGWDGPPDVYLIYLEQGTPRLRPLPVEVHPAASLGLPPQALVHSVTSIMAILAADPRFRFSDSLHGAAVLYESRARIIPGLAGTPARARLMHGISLDGSTGYTAVLSPDRPGTQARAAGVAGAVVPGEVSAALRALLSVITGPAPQADRQPLGHERPEPAFGRFPSRRCGLWPFGGEA